MSLRAIESPDPAECLRKISGIRDAARSLHDAAIIGALVTSLTNEEIHASVHLLNIGEVLTLRKLGLLAPDEGWTGP